MILFGVFLTGLGFILLSQIDSLWTYYLSFLFLSVGYSLMCPVAGWTAVADWFTRKRGTALGLVSAAVGPSGILVFGVNWLIGLYGWRTTLIIVGVSLWIVGIPCVIVIRPNPRTSGLVPVQTIPSDSALSNPCGSAREQVSIIREPGVLQAMKTRAFWIIALTCTMSSIALQSVVVHIMPYLISIHFSREQASLIIAFLVFMSTLGRFGLGVLADRLDNRKLLAFALFLQALGLFIFYKTETLWHVLIFVFIFGIGYGGLITIRISILGEYFGRRVFGSIQGITLGIILIGAMMAPVLTGMIYDIYDSYRPAWFILVIALFISMYPALKIPVPKR